MDDFTDSRRSYSIAEALSYTQNEISYCDRMEATYPKANMASLRQVATEFLAAISHEPLDWSAVEAVHQRLKAEGERNGTGWFMLLQYVTNFIKANDGTNGVE